jgi:5-methylcytosine-specific restriction enzyme A
VPVLPLSPCSHPRCPGRAPFGKRYCEQHEKQTRKADNVRRGSAASQGYDAAWRKLRHAYLSRFPLCQCDDCKASGAVVPADTVDHIEPITTHPHLRLSWDNLRSMAAAHHNRHTAKTRGWGKGSVR